MGMGRWGVDGWRSVDAIAASRRVEVSRVLVFEYWVCGLRFAVFPFTVHLSSFLLRIAIAQEFLPFSIQFVFLFDFLVHQVCLGGVG